MDNTVSGIVEEVLQKGVKLKHDGKSKRHIKRLKSRLRSSLEVSTSMVQFFLNYRVGHKSTVFNF